MIQVERKELQIEAGGWKKHQFDELKGVSKGQSTELRGRRDDARKVGRVQGLLFTLRILDLS